MKATECQCVLVTENGSHLMIFTKMMRKRTFVFPCDRNEMLAQQDTVQVPMRSNSDDWAYQIDSQILV